MRKTKTRSLLALVLALLLMLSLVACRGGKNDTTVDDTTVEDPTDPVVTDPIEDPKDTDPVVTDPKDTDPDETDPKYDPIETNPPETDPADTDPADTDPQDTTPAITTPAETTPGKDHLCVFYRSVYSAPTCLGEGIEADMCIICGDMKNEVALQPLGHKPQAETKRIESVIHHTADINFCTVCGEMLGVEKFHDDDVHSFYDPNYTLVIGDIVAVADSANEYGFVLIKCSDSDCSYSLKINSNATDGHYYTVDAGTGKYTCLCGLGANSGTANSPVFNGNPNAGPAISAAP